jgi:hypothetical protein
LALITRGWNESKKGILAKALRELVDDVGVRASLLV